MRSIKEYLLEAIQNTYVFEMAYNRKKIKEVVENLYRQIIENWCLVKYCSLNPDSIFNRTKNHWSHELSTYMFKIYNMGLKGGNSLAKRDLIQSVLIDDLEITTAKKVQSICFAKFKTEGMDMQKEVFEACVEDIYTLIELISNPETENNDELIFDYIEGL